MMYEIIYSVFEIIGTIAFAVSGAIVALKKQMDMLGVAALGLCTAVGGGVIRDMILGNTPPVMFRDPMYSVVAICASIIVFLPPIRRTIENSGALYDKILLLMDSVGLGIFTVIGVRCAYSMNDEYGIFLVTFVGVVTGVGGGVLRDVLAGNPPYIFVKHFYACASIVGAALCAFLWHRTGSTTAAIIAGSASVIVLRLLAAHFRWSLPH
ncbi:MAG: TRIC cation channel family protein [Clostridia bacterium]|nr:TRIC cation channel family protein [Clostridia bacterium]